MLDPPVDASRAELSCQPATAPGRVGDADEIADRLRGIEKALLDFHRRAAHRETVIDRLHEENQQLRAGLRRGILEPVVTDLIRLYDGLVAQANCAVDPAQAGIGDLFASFADDVGQMLDRCGVAVITAVPGELFQAGLHAAIEIVPCADPTLHNTVLTTVSAGLREHETGRMRRLVKARFYQSVRAPDTDDTDT